MVACACMGQLNGDPYCPCEMKQRGLSTAHHKVAKNDASASINEILITSRKIQFDSVASALRGNVKYGILTEENDNGM